MSYTYSWKVIHHGDSDSQSGVAVLYQQSTSGNGPAVLWSIALRRENELVLHSPVLFVALFQFGSDASGKLASEVLLWIDPRYATQEFVFAELPKASAIPEELRRELAALASRAVELGRDMVANIARFEFPVAEEREKKIRRWSARPDLQDLLRAVRSGFDGLALSDPGSEARFPDLPVISDLTTLLNFLDMDTPPPGKVS